VITLLIFFGLALLASVPSGVFGYLAWRESKAARAKTLHTHAQLANIISGMQRRALQRRQESRESYRDSGPPPLPSNRLELEVQPEEDWDCADEETGLPGAATDWDFRPCPRR
jgi:hypothetical protein